MNIPKPTPETPYIMVGQFEVGAYAHGFYFLGEEISGKSSLTTYIDIEELVQRPEIAEGAIVLDKRPCKRIDMVYKGPIDDLGLPPLTIRRLFEPTVTYASVEEAIASEPGAVTYVSLDIYCEIWRREGARIGRVVNKAVEWEVLHEAPVAK